MGGQAIGNYVLCIVIVVLILFSYDDKLTEIVYILQNATAPCYNIFLSKVATEQPKPAFPAQS